MPKRKACQGIDEWLLEREAALEASRISRGTESQVQAIPLELTAERVSAGVTPATCYSPSTIVAATADVAVATDVAIPTDVYWKIVTCRDRVRLQGWHCPIWVA